jgi:hypothetical protein
MALELSCIGDATPFCHPSGRVVFKKPEDFGLGVTTRKCQNYAKFDCTDSPASQT